MTGTHVLDAAVPLRSDGVIVAAATVAIGLIVVALFVSHPFGLGHDYPNHLAVGYIEARLGENPDLQRFYDISYALKPNLSMDLIVASLARVIGLYNAGTVMMVLAALLPALGGLLLALSLGDGRISWVSLFVFVSVFNGCLYWGLLEFLFSCGLALILLAAWIRFKRGYTRAAVFAILAILLVVSHILSFLLFAYMVALYEVGYTLTRDSEKFSSRAAAFGKYDLPALLVPLAIGLIVAFQAGGQESWFWYGWEERWSAILSAFIYGADEATFTPARLIVFSAIFYVALRERWLSVRPEVRLLCIGLLALALFAPYAVFRISLLQVRFSPIFVIVLAACCVPETTAIRVQIVAAGVLVALLGMQFADAYVSMRRTQDEMVQVRSALAQMPPGRRLLVSMEQELIETDVLVHAASYAVIERDAFVPNLFIKTTPLRVSAAMAPLTYQEQVSPAALEYGLNRALPPSRNGYWSPTYFYGWPLHFDYLLFLRRDPADTLAFTCLTPVAEHPRVVLYAIESPERLGEDAPSGKRNAAGASCSSMPAGPA